MEENDYPSTHAPYLEDNASQRVRRSTEHSPYSLSVCGEREEVKTSVNVTNFMNSLSILSTACTYIHQPILSFRKRYAYEQLTNICASFSYTKKQKRHTNTPHPSTHKY